MVSGIPFLRNKELFRMDRNIVDMEKIDNG